MHTNRIAKVRVVKISLTTSYGPAVMPCLSLFFSSSLMYLKVCALMMHLARLHLLFIHFHSLSLILLAHSPTQVMSEVTRISFLSSSFMHKITYPFSVSASCDTRVIIKKLPFSLQQLMHSHFSPSRLHQVNQVQVRCFHSCIRFFLLILLLFF